MKNNGQTGPGRSRPRRLLLCLDGVPWELIESAKTRGLFADFGSPSRLLSPFPTMTNIALSTMFDASAPLGYESLYFDTSARQLRGGIGKYIGRRTPNKVPSSYMDDLDYQEPLAFEFLVYVAPERVWRADMQRFRDRFRAAPRERDYFAFLKGTDGLLHIRGPERLSAALESLDKILREIKSFCGEETEIVLFSDHGMNLLENHRVHLQTHLRRRGFQIGERFARPAQRTVAVPAFGLCGYAAIYCATEDNIPEVAEALIELKGVDFSLYVDGAAVAIKGNKGSARIEMQQKNQATYYRYDALFGDPLRLGPLADELRMNGVLDEEGYARDEEWFKVTQDHVYPDALRNLFTSLKSPRVRHTADVLISFEDGHYYGWSPFGRFVRLAATHGNALRPSSNAFLMSTHRTLPPYVRADHAKIHLRG